MLKFLHEPAQRGEIHYINGSTFKFEDLVRCDLLKAKAVLLMANLESQDPEQSDHRNILIGLAMKKFV